MNATQPPLCDQLRSRAKRKRDLMENANRIYHDSQRARYENPIKDRGDYAQELSDCVDMEAAADEIERLLAMEQRLKSSFTRGTMDSPWLQRNALHLGAGAVAFMRWVWTGDETNAE